MLVYLHGFNSSAQSTKARTLADYLARQGLSHRYLCPNLPHGPAEAIETVESAIKERKTGKELETDALCFIGSSLGGFYATWLAERHNARAVLINPAIDPHLGLSVYLGPQTNLYTGEKYLLTQKHLDEWAGLYVPRITPERYLLLVETGDEVLDYRQAVKYYAGSRQEVVEGGDHSLQCFEQKIPLILEFCGAAAG